MSYGVRTMVDRVDVKLGWSCNNRCRFCVQGEKRTRYKDRTTGEALSLLAEARKAADEVVLTGGEVTLRRDLPELVRHATKLDFRIIQIQTTFRDTLIRISALPIAGAFTLWTRSACLVALHPKPITKDFAHLCSGADFRPLLVVTSRKKLMRIAVVG